MLLADEAPTRADLVDDIEAEGVVAEVELPQRALDEPDDLVLEDEHIQRRRLVDARDAHVAEDIGPRRGPKGQRQRGLEARLRVNALGVGQADVDVDRQSVGLADLGHRYAEDRLLGPREDELRGAHVKCMRYAAVADRRAFLNELHYADAGQDLRVLLGQRPRHRARRRQPHLRHRPDGHGQVQPRRLEEAVDAVERESKWADGLQERVAGGTLPGGVLASAKGDAHIYEVLRRGPVVEPEGDGLRGVSELLGHDLDASHGRRHIISVRHRPHDVDVPQRIAEPRRRRHIAQPRGPATPARLLDPVGLAGDAVVVALANSELGRLLEVPAVDRELLPADREGPLHHVGGNPHPLRLMVHYGALVREPPQHFPVWQMHADLAEDPQRDLVDLPDLLFTQRLTEHAAPSSLEPGQAVLVRRQQIVGQRLGGHQVGHAPVIEQRLHEQAPVSLECRVDRDLHAV